MFQNMKQYGRKDSEKGLENGRKSAQSYAHGNPLEIYESFDIMKGKEGLERATDNSIS